MPQTVVMELLHRFRTLPVLSTPKDPALGLVFPGTESNIINARSVELVKFTKRNPDLLLISRVSEAKIPRNPG